jgi:hypothetical protein
MLLPTSYSLGARRNSPHFEAASSVAETKVEQKKK